MNGRARRNIKDIWTKKALIPFWLLQSAWLAGVLVIEIYEKPLGTGLNSLIVVVFIAFCIVLNKVEIAAFALGRLQAFMYLWLQVVKTTIWLALSAIAIYDLVSSQSLWADAYGQPVRELPVMGIVIPQVTFIMCLAPLLYATVVYHSHRIGDALRARQFSDAEETLYARGPDNAMNPAEIFSPHSAENVSLGSLPECYDRPENLRSWKSRREMQDEGSLTCGVAPMGRRSAIGIGLSIGSHDDCGPYELPERKSKRSSRSSAI